LNARPRRCRVLSTNRRRLRCCHLVRKVLRTGSGARQACLYGCLAEGFHFLFESSKLGSSYLIEGVDWHGRLVAPSKNHRPYPYSGLTSATLIQGLLTSRRGRVVARGCLWRANVGGSTAAPPQARVPVTTTEVDPARACLQSFGCQSAAKARATPAPSDSPQKGGHEAGSKEGAHKMSTGGAPVVAAMGLHRTAHAPQPPSPPNKPKPKQLEINININNN